MSAKTTSDAAAALPPGRRKPKLRKLDRYPLQREDETLLVLRDPHHLDAPLAVDPALGPYLELMDGTRSISQIRQSMLMRTQQSLPLEELVAVVDTLEECGFLENDDFRARWSLALREFVQREALEFALAGIAYPESQTPLIAALGGPAPQSFPSAPTTRAIVLPHPPLQAGVDTDLFQKARQHLPPPQALDGIILLFTSHHPGAQPFQLLNKAMLTPLGPIACAQRALSFLSRDRDWLFQEALRFRQEIALELPALALRQHYGEACPPVLAVLCGRSGIEESHPASLSQDPDLASSPAGFLADLERIAQDPRWLLMACAEFSHTGAAYGHREDPALEQQAAQSDQDLFHSLCRLDLSAFGPSALKKLADHCRPSGAACLQTFLSLLCPQSVCQVSAYKRTLAPQGSGYFGQALAIFKDRAGSR